jgi:DNA-binding NtrC family response regulator
MTTESATPIETLRLGAGALCLGCEQRVTLLLYHRRGVSSVPLLVDRKLVVGRDRGADVWIDDPAISREHAIVELVDGEVWIEDLGSTNGCRIGGEPLRGRGRVRPGDELSLGGLPATIHRLAPSAAPLQGVESHERFLEELEREVLRQRFFGESCGLLLLRPAAAGAPLASFCAELQHRLRPVDRLGLYGRATLEVLLPRADLSMVRELAGTLAVPRSAARRPSLLVGAAAFPQSAASAGALLEAARSALERASSAEPAVEAPVLGQRALELPGAVVVRSAAMREVMAAAERLARSSVPVLILGETGTGKEVVARAIHGASGRGPLPCINCAAIPQGLTESLLFGHEKGAFTGADRQQRGLFEEADGGSVFLDEIGELSPSAQAALLRVLDTKRITRVGSTREIPVNVRVLAATHRDLDAMCEAGAFRRDLLFRINTMTLRLPPLRERREEIEPLVESFLAEARAAGETTIEGMAPPALELLLEHRWPGNVRELRNVVCRALALAEGPLVTVADLPEDLRRGRPDEEVACATPAGDALGGELEPEPGLDYRGRVQRFELQLLREALEQCGWNKTRAAERLRIPIRTLIYKVQAFGLRPD